MKQRRCVFVVGWLTQRSAEIKGAGERMRRRGEKKLRFHMQVAVEDVYLKTLVSRGAPGLENEQKLSRVHFSQTS